MNRLPLAAREGFSEEVTFELRSEWQEGGNQEKVGEELSRLRNNHGSDPKVP